MSAFAICVRENCPFLFDMQEEVDGKSSRVPPHSCPICRGHVTFYCPGCNSPIMSASPQQAVVCLFCGVNVRKLCLRNSVSVDSAA